MVSYSTKNHRSINKYFSSSESVFSSPDDEANINKIEKVFGATHPGVYDEEQKMFIMKWRGVCFCFPAKDSSKIQSYAHGLGSLQFSTDSLPFLQRMMIFSGNNPSEPKMPEMPLVAYCGNIYLKSIQSLSKNGTITGLVFNYYAEDSLPNSNKKHVNPPLFERTVYLGDTEHQVLSALGAPNKTFFKSDEKMLIQRGPNQLRFDDNKPDIFFNYFSLGTVSLIFFIKKYYCKQLLAFARDQNMELYHPDSCITLGTSAREDRGT